MDRKLNSIIVIVLLILLFSVYTINKKIDKANENRLKYSPCHRIIPHPKFNDGVILSIEEVIDNYNTKQENNKSNCKRILHEIESGALRGGLGASILSASPILTVQGAIIGGAIGGCMKGLSLLRSEKKLIKDGP